ncbi:MAG: class I SAM-dependent methyltransferase, partial [Flammeovirgaceae bacterium]|nr:class I SAM-dependent methyltransferase [Flammeovirgaceae bacterium]
MKIFDIYSEYYDLLYKDKDYQKESEYIHQLIQQYHPSAQTLLNLGCGTGRHDYELAKVGYKITGIDLSDKMINKAIENTPHHLKDKVKFFQGDARNSNLNEKFDVVLALFHVMSYQTTNEDISAFFNTAKNHLKPEGIFIFDCWY